MKADSLPQFPLDATPPDIYPPINGDIWLYFIQQKMGGPINIGGTKNVKRRLSDLQAANADELRLMACIRARPSMELDLHVLLEPLKIRTKWFKSTELTQNLMYAARQDGAVGLTRLVRENCYLKD